jgi:hypothetical protein
VEPLSITYRLIVTRRTASEILLLPNGSGWALPRVEIDRRQRLAEQLTAEVRRSFGANAYCLFAPRTRTSEPNEQASYFVMESVEQNGRPPAGTYWMPSVVAGACCDPSDAEAITESLAQLNSWETRRNAGPFARPGWLRELFLWSQEQVEPHGLRLNGRFKQLNASPTFSLIRLETNEDAIWFKATGEPNSHELSATAALTRLFPRSLPQLFGIHHAWNGWLLGEAKGTALDEVAEPMAWERAAEGLAKLQIESVEKTNELLTNAHLKDLRLAKLVERIDPFVTRMNELMAAQEMTIPVALVESELAILAERLKESCTLLESCRLPDSLGHLDFNPGNILMSEGRCVFIDWAEGCVTNPFVTFEYLLEHMTRSRIEEPGLRERVATAYLGLWMSLCSLDALRQAFAVSSVVAVFAYAVANDSWRSPIRDAKHAAYFRSLTRRMYREALHSGQRSEQCLS